jgi:hypothetical protein
MKLWHHSGFLLFLIVYSYLKYAVAPAMLNQPGFLFSTAIMITLTAIIPYGAAFLIAQKIPSRARYGVAFIVPVLLAFAGLATYFFIFIAPSGAPVTLAQVLPRALKPGLIMGLLVLIPIWLQRKR